MSHCIQQLTWLSQMRLLSLVYNQFNEILHLQLNKRPSPDGRSTQAYALLMRFGLVYSV